MSDQTVEDLEDELAELQATVTGLTEELVEAHERIRQIERALAGDSEAAREAAREAAADVAVEAREAVEGADPEEVAQAAARAETTSAGPAPDSEFDSTEGDKGEQPQENDEADGELDDIIVA